MDPPDNVISVTIIKVHLEKCVCIMCVLVDVYRFFACKDYLFGQMFL